MRYTPLIVVITYLVLTLAITITGPIDYYDFDAPLVSAYIFMICVSMAIGYHLAVRAKVVEPKMSDTIPRSQIPVGIFSVALGVAFVGFVFTLGYFIFSGTANLDVSSIGEAYNQNYQGYEKNSGEYSLSFILYSLIAAPVFIATIWGLWYFRRLPLVVKILVVLVVFGTPAIFTLSAGTQKSIGDVIVYLIAIFGIRSAVRGRLVSARTVIMVVGIAFLGIFLFASILGQRYAALGIGEANINAREIGLLAYKTDHPVFAVMGSDAGFALSAVCMYLTNGLNGLSYALHLDSTWSYFLGASYSISVVAQRLFGLPLVYYDTYPYQAAMISGWGESRWYTVFSWFASDFTFVGTIPLFGFFSYVYARCWIESITFRNPFSILLFCLMSLGVLMMPANNQLMQTPGALATLGVTVILYLRFRRQYNRQIPAQV